MRHDRFIENDSGAYSIMGSWVLDEVIEDGRENDLRFVKEHRAILQALVGDATFVARVVVDEPLSGAERAEWISRVVWPLDVRCGRLLIAGGFDPDSLADLAEDESSFVDVPPGKYTVEVLTYLDTMNGRVLRERWGPEARLGCWFRRDHPGRPFPTWVASELFWAPEEDPGHEALWRSFAGSVAAGSLSVERGPWSWAGVVVHLTRGDDAPGDLSPLSPDGFFPEDLGLRRPDRFPSGLPSRCDVHTVADEVYQVLSKDA